MHAGSAYGSLDSDAVRCKYATMKTSWNKDSGQSGVRLGKHRTTVRGERIHSNTSEKWLHLEIFKWKAHISCCRPFWEPKLGAGAMG